MADTRGLSLRAVTVDHGLRAGSAEEATGVAACCAALGVPHDTLQWADWDGSGNLQAAARDARYRLMADWAARHDIGAIALGHTADDQAETFVMRLARRSGVDGLSAMAPHSVRAGIEWLRPLLGIHRA
ncbi:tRNA lysidine(34) synthetase TilS, partial [Sulfitobacter sp. HI0129]